MTWHLEITSMTARRYLPGDSFEARSDFASVAQVQVLGGNKAFISGFLNDSGKGEIPRREWLALRDALRARGIELVRSERKGEPRDFETGPAPLS